MNVSIASIDVSEITRALQNQLKVYPALADVPVTRGEDRNLDPSGCPWIGIYRLNAVYAQRTMGYGGGVRDQRVRLLILIQAADQSSGEACEETLEALIKHVVDAVLSDTTLGATVGAVEDFEVDYASYDRSGNVYMQTAALQIVAVGTTRASVS